ncbi:uncharacterized protein METZ01_LOCUS406066, partial [marine metagenome]
MINIGILGSSYSRGQHYDKGNTVPTLKQTKKTLANGNVPFEHWFEKHKTKIDYNFINVALPGHGTEHYLNKIISLKRCEDIKAVVIESVGNRSGFNYFDEKVDANFRFIYGRSIYELGRRLTKKEGDLKQLVRGMFNNNMGLLSYYENCFVDTLGYKLNTADYKQYKKSALRLARIDTSQEFFGFLDLYQSISLCNMLDIKCILWGHSWGFEDWPGFQEMLQGATYVLFPNAINAKEYYRKKYKYDDD